MWSYVIVRVTSFSRSASANSSPAQILAGALNVTTDELLGVRTGRSKKITTLAVSSRLERRLKLIERMPPKPKQQLLGLIDTFLAAANKA